MLQEAWGPKIKNRYNFKPLGIRRRRRQTGPAL